MSWLERITDTSVPLSTHATDAACWRTCAVGEAHAAAPFVVRIDDTRIQNPVDKKLDDLGMKFFRHVCENQRAAAMRTYLAIQERVAQLAGIRVRR